MSGTATKPTRVELLRLAKELGIALPEEGFAKLLADARAADDPEQYIREAAKPPASAEPQARSSSDAQATRAMATTATATAAGETTGAAPMHRTGKYNEDAIRRFIAKDSPTLRTADVRDLVAICGNCEHGDEQFAAIKAYAAVSDEVRLEQTRAAMRQFTDREQRRKRLPQSTGPAKLPTETANLVKAVGFTRRQLLLSLEQFMLVHCDRLPQDYWGHRFIEQYFDPDASALFTQIFGTDRWDLDRGVGKEIERCRRLKREVQTAGSDADRQAARQRADLAAKNLAERAPDIQREIDRVTAELGELHRQADEASQDVARRDRSLVNLRAICIPDYVREDATAAGNDAPIDEYLASMLG